MKRTIIAVLLMSMFLFAYPLFAGINKATFEESIQLMDHDELTKQLSLSNLKLTTSVLGTFTGPILAVGSGYVSYKTGGAILISFFNDDQMDLIDLGGLVLAVPLFFVSSAVMLGAIALTEGSIRGIIAQNKRIDAIRLEMIKFKSVSYDDKPGTGIGISIPL